MVKCSNMLLVFDSVLWDQALEHIFNKEIKYAFGHTSTHTYTNTNTHTHTILCATGKFDFVFEFFSACSCVCVMRLISIRYESNRRPYSKPIFERIRAQQFHSIARATK